MFGSRHFFWGGWMTQQRRVIADKSFIFIAAFLLGEQAAETGRRYFAVTVQSRFSAATSRRQPTAAMHGQAFSDYDAHDCTTAAPYRQRL